MYHWFYRNWIMGLLIGGLMLGMACSVYFAADIGRPFGGLLSIAGSPDGHTPVWWPGMIDGARMYSYKMRILGTEGELFTKNRFPKIFAEAKAAGQTTVPVIFRYDEIYFIQHDLPVLEFGWAHYVDLKAPPIITGLGLWLLAWIVYRTRPDAPSNRLLAISFVLFALNRWLTYTNIYWDEDMRRTFFHFFFWNWCNPFLGVVLLHFALVFPKPNRYRFFILSPGYAWAIFVGISLSIETFSGGYEWPLWFHKAGTRFYGSMLPTILGVGLTILYYFYLRFGTRLTPRVRYQLDLILMGLSISTIPFATVFFGMWYERVTSIPLYWFGLNIQYLWLAIPLTLAYAILRYQSLRAANRTMVITLIMMTSALVASFGASLMRWLEPSLSHVQTVSPFAPLFVMGLIFGTFWSWQSSSRGRLAKLFHRQTLNYSATHRFGERLIGQTQLTRLPTQIVEGAVEELNLERAALWLWHTETHTFRLQSYTGSWERSPPQNLAIPPDSEGFGNPDGLAAQVGVEILQPLTTSSGAIGWLGLGKRWDEEIFDDSDLDIMGLITQQTTLFILTAQQIAELQQVPQQISKAQEEERFRLNQDLHDTTQQFLGRLPYLLATSQLKMEADPASSQALLARCINDVEDAARTLRRIRADLAPERLAKGLVQPLADRLHRLTMGHTVKLTLDLAPEIDGLTDERNRLALYRIAEEAVNNALKHAQATIIRVTIYPAQTGLEFSLADDGLGFPPKRIAQAKANGHFGFVSMQGRVNSLGGRLEISSRPDQGTTIAGWLPLGNSPPD